MNILLGFDLGTSATKGIALSTDGDVLFQNKVSTKLTRTDPGYIEFDPEEYFQDFCQLIKELTDNLPAGSEVKAISMAAASGNTLLVDDQDKPLTKVINWMDTRTQNEKVETLEKIDPETVHQVVGWPFNNWFPLAHLAWFKENEPEKYKNTGCYCMNTNYVYYRLTGKWGVDYSTATPFYLQDQIKRCWYKPFLDLLAISDDKLPSLFPSGTVLGNIHSESSAKTGLSPSTKVILGSFDHPSAARGTGTLNVGDLLFSCGTSWVGFFPVNDRNISISMKILSDPFLSPNGPWGAIFSLPCIGEKIEWYIDKYISDNPNDKYDKFNNLATAASIGANGLMINLMADPEPLTDNPDSTSVARAIMESAAFFMRDYIEKFTGPETGIKAENINMVGGPSNSQLWTQILSDVTGLEFKLSPYRQNAGALGAAILAGIGSKYFKNEQDGFDQIKSKPQIISPNKTAYEKYEDIYKKFKNKFCKT